VRDLGIAQCSSGHRPLAMPFSCRGARGACRLELGDGRPRANQDWQLSKAWERLRENHLIFYVVFQILFVGAVIYVIWEALH